MFRALAEMPRKILPPPTTMPIWMPAFRTSATSTASSLTRSALMPNAAPPASDSPLSLSRIRLYRDTGFGGRFRTGLGGGRVAYLEARETGDRDVLAQLG